MPVEDPGCGKVVNPSPTTGLPLSHSLNYGGHYLCLSRKNQRFVVLTLGPCIICVSV